MSDRHQIMDDRTFWLRLEYDAGGWLADKIRGGLWIDGFMPEFITDTKRGVDIEGVAWVANGGREQYPYRFPVSVPQKMLHRRRDNFSIEELNLDESRKILQIRIVNEREVA
jgi:hypothetical protein